MVIVELLVMGLVAMAGQEKNGPSAGHFGWLY